VNSLTYLLPPREIQKPMCDNDIRLTRVENVLNFFENSCAPMLLLYLRYKRRHSFDGVFVSDTDFVVVAVPNNLDQQRDTPPRSSSHCKALGIILWT
jgi:hypothetical protein